MVLSLPNHLTGFVSCDRISSYLTEKFTAITNGDEAISPEIPSLSQYYQPGELVVAAIASVESPKTGGKRRRIELSLLPEKVNAGLLRENFVAGIMVSGEITSHEDRGYTIKFGLEGDDNSEFLGFLPDSDVPVELEIGKTIPCMISSSFQNKNSRVVTLTIDPKIISETVFDTLADINSLRCGTLVNAKVVSTKGSHLIVSVAGHEGRIDVLNLPDNTMLKRHKELDLAEHFPIGKKILTRICHVFLEEKHFILSAILNITKWSAKAEGDRIGERVEGAVVHRIDPGLGLVVSIGGNDSSFAYVHISRLADKRVESIEGPFKVGSKHNARLVDYDVFTGLYQASFKESVMKEAILRIQDIHPGQIVRGEVMKIEPFGILVSLTDRIRAICPKFHLTEVQSDQAVRSYNLRQKYKFRVIDCDVKTRRITTSRKKGLLDSPLPPLCEFTQAVPGNQHDGFIVAIKNFGCIVRFYGQVKGIVTVAEMCDEYVDRPQDSFFIGQVVRCKIIKCDPTTKELKLSFRKQTGPKLRPDGTFPGKRSQNDHEEPLENFKFAKEQTTLEDLIVTN